MLILINSLVNNSVMWIIILLSLFCESAAIKIMMHSINKWVEYFNYFCYLITFKIKTSTMKTLWISLGVVFCFIGY